MTEQEKDPGGKSPHQPGAKLDQGKVRAGLLFRDFGSALREIAQVTTFGADKYTPSGWRHVPNGKERYFDAAIRHLLVSGVEELDAESGLGHLEHAVWNLLAVIELNQAEKGHEGNIAAKLFADKVLGAVQSMGGKLKKEDLVCFHCDKSVAGEPSIITRKINEDNTSEKVAFCTDCYKMIHGHDIKSGGTI